MKNEKIFSGERFYPEMQDEELEIEHLQRYYAAQRLVKDKDVLDAACGEGYGSNILAEQAKSVVGIDIDKETVDRANQKYGVKKNLKYIQASIADLSIIPDASKDVVVSFETIEHVSRETQNNFLKEIKRILKPDGFMIMSTPNKKEYTDRYNFHNQFHVAEFYLEEFIEFLNREFKNVHLYNQYLEVASFIDEANICRDNMDYIKDIERYNPVGKYVIAIVSNGELPKEKMCAVYMHHREEYLPILDELNYCRGEAITCRKKVENLDKYINENKLQKEELDRRLEELYNRQELINELRREKAELDNVNRLQKEELDRRLKELDNRQELINELGREKAELDNKNRLQNEELEHYQGMIDLVAQEKENLYKELDKRLAELKDINDIINTQEQELQKLRKWSIRYQIFRLRKKR